jgi:hypothetical protein
MRLEGGCYCGAVRYLADGEPVMKAQCHCRKCQYITGGAPNMFLAVRPDSFKYTKGAPKQFTRSDLEKPVTREFCPECGTHLASRPKIALVVIKVGALDDPALLIGRSLRSTPSASSRFTKSPKACRPSSACRRVKGRTGARRTPKSSLRRWLIAS